jgi:hypothetical protein
MGLTNTFTQLGISTGNTDMAKIGTVGSTLVDSFKRVKSLKGLKGIEKTAGIAGIAGGAADTVKNVLFGN